MAVLVAYQVSKEGPRVKRILLENFGYKDNFRAVSDTVCNLPDNTLYHPEFDEQTALSCIQNLAHQMGLDLLRAIALPANGSCVGMSGQPHSTIGD